MFETITSNVKSFFEKKKLEMTTSINEELEESSKEDKQENENSSNETHSHTSSKKDKKNKFKKKITFSATSKRAKLIQTIERVKNALKEFKPTLLNSKEVLNFYAEYINGKYIAFNPKLKRLSDSYIASNVHFKKDYFVIEFQNQNTFCACVGIKAYESEEISSLPISTLLHTQIELDLIFHIRSLGQFESLNFLKTKKKLTLSKIVKADIDNYKENYFNEENLKNNSSKLDYLKQELKDLETLQSSVMIPIHTEIKLYDLKNEESKDYELIKVKEVEPLKENASMSEELTHKKLKEQNKQIAEQNKEKLDAIKKQFASNLNDLFFNEERDCKLLEYKGFVVNAYKTKYQVEFSLSPKDNPNIAYSPSNMVYKNDTANMFSSYNFCGEIKFDGFLKRLDNAITKLPEKIKELENSIETTQENIAKYTRLVEQKPSYPRLEYLQALKWDHKTLIDDLAKMSKDRDYKPVFNPKSKEVLEKMNAEKRASLVDESKTITEIENSNKEQEIKGNTKSDDEVKQYIEQVIEKEIGKGAEIISSKEVAITNNVDYYENEEELETTQSRSRR